MGAILNGFVEYREVVHKIMFVKDLESLPSKVKCELGFVNIKAFHRQNLSFKQSINFPTIHFPTL
jgi:hypothetical protein